MNIQLGKLKKVLAIFLTLCMLLATNCGLVLAASEDPSAQDSSVNGVWVTVDQNNYTLNNNGTGSDSSINSDDVFTFNGNWRYNFYGWITGFGDPGHKSFTMKFTGTEIKVYGQPENNTGSFKYYIDDELKGTVDTAILTADESGDALFLDMKDLTPGPHELKIENNDDGSLGGFIRFDKFEYYRVDVEAAGKVVRVGTTTYANGWSDAAGFFSNFQGKDASAWETYGGQWLWMMLNRKLASGEAASFDFNFEGSEISVTGVDYDQGNLVKFYIDGEYAGEHNSYDAGYSWPNTHNGVLFFQKKGLQSIPHSLTVEVVEVTEERAQNTLIAFQEFKYMEPATPARFTGPESIIVTPGQNVEISITRDVGAQEKSGSYVVTVPDGWPSVADVPFVKNSTEDRITIPVPASYNSKKGVITVQPKISTGSYPRINITVPIAVLKPMADLVSLQDSSKYRSEISGMTQLDIVVPGGGYTKAIAQYVCVPDATNTNPHGWLNQVNDITLDTDGKGSFTVDTAKMPRGPVCVYVKATGTRNGMTISADGYFDFWNNDGVDWNKGLVNANDRKAYAKDMTNWEKVWEDDFDGKSSISYTGAGADYAAHYPNSQDDRRSWFADPASEYNPFKVVDNTYLKITTTKYDEPITGSLPGLQPWNNMYTSGCISSAHESDRTKDTTTGIWTDGYRDQFFEARIFTPSNPGQWPAFWTMSNLFETRAGIDRTDELDILEAWTPTSKYTINTHAWDPKSTDGNLTYDKTLGAGTDVDTEGVLGQGMGNIMMGWHTYGCLITEATTYYYFDGIMVHSERTLPYSYRCGNFFLLNIGIANDNAAEGYGFDRYGTQSDMYVDWVRVYESPAPAQGSAKFVMGVDYLKTQNVTPGTTLTVQVERTNAAAQNIAGTLKLEGLPEGWTVVGGTNNTLPFIANSNPIDVKLQVPEDYAGYSASIKITVCDEKGDPITGQEILNIATNNTADIFGISIYPVYNTSTSKYDVKVTLENKRSPSLPGGTLTVKDKDGNNLGTVNFKSLVLHEKVTVSIENVPINVMSRTNLTVEVTRLDGYQRTIIRPMSGLMAVYTESPIDVTKQFNLAEWDNDMKVHLGTSQYTGGTFPGEDKFSIDQFLKWDNSNLYFAAVVTDNNHNCPDGLTYGVFDFWNYDSIQISIDPTRAYDLYPRKNHIRYIGGVTPSGEQLGRENDGVQNPDGIQYNFYRDTENGKTYYLLAFPWSSYGIDPAKNAADIGISYLVNNAGPGTRFGFLHYMDGIGSGDKDPYVFGDLILKDGQTTYTITNATMTNGTVTADKTKATEGDTVTLTVTPDEGYRLKNGSLKVDGGAITGYSFTMPAANVIVTAEFEEIPTSTHTTSQAPSPTPIQVAKDGSVKVTVKPIMAPGANTAITELREDIYNALVKAAKSDDKGVKKVIVEVEKVEDAKTYKQELPIVSLASNDSNVSLEIKTPLGTIVAPSNMFASDSVAATANVGLSIALADITSLDSKTKEAIGNKPVVELSAAVDGKTAVWRNNDAPVTISIDYTPTAEELKNPDSIVVWYINSNGKVQPVPNGKYDKATGKVTFTTTHFSKYAIAYNFKTFQDAGKYKWAQQPIEMVASKGILSGTSQTMFSPDDNITRAEFIDSLIKALGLSAEFDTNFVDVKKTDNYYESVGIAKKLGISRGTGNNRFSPNAQITRQEMATFVVRALELANKAIEQGNVSDLKKYSDVSKIAKYAVENMASLVKTNILAGSGNRLDPNGKVTRAQTAVVMWHIYYL